jgi:hypothetical protein
MQKWNHKTQWIQVEVKPDLRVYPVAPNFVFGTPFHEFKKELLNEFVLISATKTPGTKLFSIPLTTNQVLKKATFNVETLNLTCEIGSKSSATTIQRHFLLEMSTLEFTELVSISEPDHEIRNPLIGDNWGSLETDIGLKKYKDISKKLKLAPNNHLYFHKEFVFLPSNSSEDGFSRMHLYQNDKLILELADPSVPGLAIIPVGNSHGMLFDWHEGYVKNAVWFVYHNSTLCFFGIE